MMPAFRPVNTRADQTSTRAARAARRRQILQSLGIALGVEAVLTLAVFLLLGALRKPLPTLSGHALLWTSVGVILTPSCLGGLVGGYLTPRFRWQQFATAGALAGVCFLLFSGPARLDVALRLYLAINLVFGMTAGAWAGHQIRQWRDRADAYLEPRPWGE